MSRLFRHCWGLVLVVAACWLLFQVPFVTGQESPPSQAQSGSTESEPAANEATPDETTAKSDTSAKSATAATTSEASAAKTADENKPKLKPEEVRKAFIALAVGIATVLGLIILVKVNAFLALIIAAMVVSLLSPMPLAETMKAVAFAFGDTAGKIGIVIALASIIGTCMLDSGAADRIVRSFVNLLGVKRAPMALMGSGFVLAVPVFFDTVFYLLVPLARSLYRRTGNNYLLYLMAICAGGAITHGLVPPTPGPLTMAAELKIDLGVMILVGAALALPAAIAGLIYSYLINRWMPIEMRPLGTEPEREMLKDEELPGLIESLTPVLLPVILITMHSIADAFYRKAVAAVPAGDLAADNSVVKYWAHVMDYTSVIGNANFALMISTLIAMVTLARKRAMTRIDIARVVEHSLMSGGVIILITSGGGAFGGMLKEANVGKAIEQVFAGPNSGGIMVLVLGFAVATIMKVAQGSGTVAMVTTATMLKSLAAPEMLGFDPVYLAVAIGSGATCGSWMNDSGFWVVAKMGGLTEMETLKSWTILLLVLGVTGFICALIAVQILPFPLGEAPQLPATGG